MLQRDIATPDMDVRYVSALSWYFLNLFGLNGLFKLMLGSENGEQQSLPIRCHEQSLTLEIGKF
jgi:hypothetical protein